MPREALALVFSEAGRPLEPRTLAVPDPAGAEAVVRVTGCTLCGSDLHTYEGRRPTPVPTILGHEIIGQVAALGPDAPRRDLAGQELAVGHRVTWSLAASCGACFFCDRRLPQKCARLVKYGHERLRPGFELSGGLAEYVHLIPGTALLRLPPALPDEAACPASCATSTVAAALDAAGELTGRTVLVLGAGILGLTACAMARAAGADDVVCCDVQAPRLERAEAFRATRLALPGDLDAVVSRATGGHGVDVAVEVSGAADAVARCLSLVRTGGTVVLVGAVFPTPPVSVAPEQLVRRHLTIRGVHNYAPQHLLAAVQFLAESREPFAALVADWLPLRSAEEAFRRARSPGVFRVGVRP
jgi:alcohol dehydrogenase